MIQRTSYNPGSLAKTPQKLSLQKNYQGKHQINQFQDKRKPKRQQHAKFKKCHGKTLESGLWHEIYSKPCYKGSISLHQAPLCIQVIEKSVVRAFEWIRWVWEARDPSGHLQQCKNYTGATRWGRATRWAVRATCWEFLCQISPVSY